MKKDKNKVIVILGFSCVFLSVTFAIISLLGIFIKYPFWMYIAFPILAVVFFVCCIVLTPKKKVEPKPVVMEEKKTIVVTSTKVKIKRTKTIKEPFISVKEWNELEEEDDEMMFIEEVVEDD